LAKRIFFWSDPKGIIIWKADFAKLLIRKHRIQESLNLVLFSWTSKLVLWSWKSREVLDLKVISIISVFIYLFIF